MDKKNINIIVTGVGILLGVGGLFLIGRKIVKNVKEKAEKEKADKVKEELENTQGSQEMQQQEQAQAKAYNPSKDAKWINDAITTLGGNFNNSDAEELNNTIMRLSDLKLKKIASHYKSKYGESLYKALDDEWDTCFKGWTNPFADCYTSSLKRLARLGLK
jgi:flagellar biosynthesis/type III secretory pathway M-ring protein FliF/YscJ